MSDMDRVCKCGKTLKNHWWQEGHPYCHITGDKEFQAKDKLVLVKQDFVDAVRELVKAAWSVRALLDCYMTAAHGEYYQKKIESVESMLSDMDKKEDV